MVFEMVAKDDGQGFTLFIRPAFPPLPGRTPSSPAFPVAVDLSFSLAIAV